MCPTGEDLIYRKFLWLYQVNSPATERDMAGIVRAFEKIYANLDRLRDVRPDEINLEYKR